MYAFDGIPLDDPQGRWYLNTKTGLRIVPARMRSGASLPGRDGALASLGSAYETGSVAISLTVRRPTHGEVMSALEILHGVFGQRHRVIPLVHDYGDGQKRVAEVEVLSSMDHELLLVEHVRLDVLCEVPASFWRDLATVDASATITASTVTATLAPLAGSTGAINDSLLRFKGPFSSATVTDPVSGDSLAVNLAAAATEYVVVDTASWVARKHTTDSWSTTAGTNVAASVVSNRGSGPMLTLNPDFTTGAGRVRLTVKGTGTAAGASVTVRAKRSFL